MIDDRPEAGASSADDCSSQSAPGAAEGSSSGSRSFAQRRVLRIVLTILLLLLIAWLVDLRAAMNLFREAQWRWVLLAVLIVQLQIVLSALRWQITAVRLGQELSVPHAIREYYLATLANLSLPGGVTGDAARIYRNRYSAGAAASAKSVLIERLAGQLALLLVTITGWVLWPFLMHGTSPAAGQQLLLIALFALVLLLMLFFVLRRFAGRAVSTFIDEMGVALYRVWVADRQWLIQGLLSLAVVGTYLVVFACSAMALHQSLPVAGVVSVVPLVLLSMIIPLSIGGWGIREAVAVSLWPLMGLSVEAAIGTSVLYGLISTIGSVPGALWAMRLPRTD